MNLNNLVHYCEDFNLPDPLTGIKVPAPLNKSLTRSAIMVRCGLLTPVFGEPDVFRETVSDWFDSMQWSFSHLVKIIEAEYSPVENYDRMEDWNDSSRNEKENTVTRKDTRQGSHAKDYTETTGEDLSGKDTRTIGVENTISAENTSTYQPDTKTDTTDEIEYGKKTDGTKTGSETGNEQQTGSGSETGKQTETESGNRTGRVHGNIGVQQAPDMILTELKMLDTFDPYKWIAYQFEKAHMLMIY